MESPVSRFRITGTLLVVILKKERLPEQALVREVKEELDFDLKDFKFFKEYLVFGSVMLIRILNISIQVRSICQ